MLATAPPRQRRPLRAAVLTLLVGASAATGAADFADCPQFFATKPPAITNLGQLREICFSEFAVLHSGETKTPNYVAQRLNASMLDQGRDLKRSNQFYAEARLPRAERAELGDYKGSGWSRGHMAPAGDMATWIQTAGT